MGNAMRHSLYFSPIKVVKADITGVVWDGPGLSYIHDIDYTSDQYTVTLHFHGFESELNGISNYLWGLGTKPGIDDVKGFSEYGIINEGTNVKGNHAMYLIDFFLFC